MRLRLRLPWLLLFGACAPIVARQPGPGATHQVVAVARGGEGFKSPAAAGEPSGRTPCGEAVCWTSTSNPSLEQAEQLAELRRAAAMFRSKARALTEAEDRECAGLEQEERDVSPFYHRDDIVSVQLIDEKARTGKGAIVRTAGVRVQFRAVPGLTAARLRLQIDCQIARAAATGHALPEAGYCPLSLSGVDAQVFVMGNGFVVEIKAEDAQTVEEILRRVYALRESRDPLIFISE